MTRVTHQGLRDPKAYIMSGNLVGERGGNGLGMKILIVDDESAVVEVLRMALQALGYVNVESAYSASEALAMVKNAKSPIECFLVDIQMPEHDGIALCKALRDQRAYKRTPILMLTAMSERKYFEQSFSAGANDYIVKPFQIDDLITRIDAAARLHREIISGDGSARKIAPLRQGQTGKLKLKLEDAVSFDGVAGFLEQPTFDNYIDHLERSQVGYGGVVAVRISDIQRLYGCSTAQEFLGLLSDMSKLISAALQDERFHFTYAGSGRFSVLALDEDDTGFDQDVDFLVKEELSRVDLRFPKTDPSQVRITTERVSGKSSGGMGSIDLPPRLGSVWSRISRLGLRVARQRGD